MIKNKILKICDFIIEIGWLSIVFLTPVYFAIFQQNFNIFELNKIVIFRVLLIIILLVFILKIFIKENFSYYGSNKIFFLIGFIFLTFFVSSYFSLHPQSSWWGSYYRQQGMYSLVSYFLFFILLILNLKDFKQIKQLIVAAIFSSLLVVIYGLIQYFYLDPLSWEENILVNNRIFSTFGQPNFLGHYLILIIPLSIYSLFFIVKNFYYRLALLILILAQFTCLIFTYSRSAWLGFMSGLGLLIIIWLSVKNRWKTILYLFIAGLIIIVCLTVVNVKKFSPQAVSQLNFINRISLANFLEGSGKIRLYYWTAAIEELTKTSWTRLLFGYGPETANSIFVKYYQSEWGVYENINSSIPDRAHNAILDNALSFGLIGLLIILLFYSYFITQSIKYFKHIKKQLTEQSWLVIVLLATFGAYFVNNLFSFSVTTSYVYFYLYLAILWFIFNNQKLIKIVNINLKFFSRLIIFLVLLIIAFIFIYYQNINYLLADYYYAKVKTAETKKDCKQVLNNTEKVVGFYSGNIYYQDYYLRNYINCFSVIKDKTIRQGMRNNMIAQIDSINQQELNYSIKLTIAHVKAILGFYIDPIYYNSAEEDYHALININPYIMLGYKGLARMKLWQKNYNEAIIYSKKGIEVMPLLNHPALNQQHRVILENELVDFYTIIKQSKN
ncbi:MAG: O-antigen ligase family protein [Patescibacteria group bacterium]